MKNSFLGSLVLILCFSSAAFSAGNDEFDAVPEECTIRMDQASVVEVARRAARSKDIDLDRYELPDVSFEFLHHRWTVAFDEKSLSFDGRRAVVAKTTAQVSSSPR